MKRSSRMQRTCTNTITHTYMCVRAIIVAQDKPIGWCVQLTKGSTVGATHKEAAVIKTKEVFEGYEDCLQRQSEEVTRMPLQLNKKCTRIKRVFPTKTVTTSLHEDLWIRWNSLLLLLFSFCYTFVLKKPGVSIFFLPPLHMLNIFSCDLALNSCLHMYICGVWRCTGTPCGVFDHQWRRQCECSQLLFARKIILKYIYWETNWNKIHRSLYIILLGGKNYDRQFLTLFFIYCLAIHREQCLPKFVIFQLRLKLPEFGTVSFESNV